MSNPMLTRFGQWVLVSLLAVLSLLAAFLLPGCVHHRRHELLDSLRGAGQHDGWAEWEQQPPSTHWELSTKGEQ